jgi:hypothetical protein
MFIDKLKNLLNEVKYGSAYILLQHDGLETGGHQEKYREEGKNGLMFAVLIILFRANTLFGYLFDYARED